jgi:hypothetical protein
MGGINSINYACYREVNNQHMLAFKVHMIENFFWLRFCILYYFIVSYPQILRFCKKIFYQATIGEDTIIPLSLRLSRIEFCLV